MGRFDLGQLGKTSPVAGQVQTVVIHPAMISTVAPTGLLIQVTQFLRDAISISVRLMPNRSLRFEQASIFNQHLTVKILVQVFGPLPQESDKGLYGRVELFETPRQGRSHRDRFKSKLFGHITMLD